MNHENIELPDSNSERRGLHASSYVVMASIAAVLVLLNVPGHIVIAWDLLAEKDSLKPTYPRFEEQIECLHGWPLTYLHRDPMVTIGSPPETRLSYWLVGRGVKSFAPGKLLLNILLSVPVIWTVGRVYEWWRRRRSTLLQLHVIDVMAIAGFVAVCSWILVYNYSVHDRQERALERITISMPKSVNWGDRAFDRSRWQPSRIAWIKEFREHPYVSVFDRIVGFTVGGEELPLLEELEHLQYVKVRGNVSNEQLRSLTLLPHLIVLDLSVSQVTDNGEPAAGAMRLPPLPNLRGLNFGGSAEFRGDGLEGLDRIEVLDLSGTALTDDGLAKLGDLDRLKHLYLDATEITNDGVASLKRFKNLERLSIRFLEVDEQGLQSLVELQNLRWLFLYRAEPLSEAEKAIVASMPKLQNPDLGIADEIELRDLKNAFPGEVPWRTR